MSEKVLPGVSREAWRFLASHWMSLAKMSVIPFVAYFGIAIVQLKMMTSLYRNMGGMIQGGGFDPVFMGAYMRVMGLSTVGSVLGFVLMCLLFAQIVRFHQTGAASWIMTDMPGIKAGLMTLVYGLGIMFLTLFAYLGGAILFAIIMVIAGLLLGTDGAGGALVAIVGILGFLALLAGLYWFAFRFLVGLPGVALGHSPDFFRDMWPLSRGESWGLPLRMLFATLLAYVPLGLIMVVFGGSAFMTFFEQTIEVGGEENPARMFVMMADLMDGLAPAMAASFAIFAPFMWFMTLLLAIAFHRFRARGT